MLEGDHDFTVTITDVGPFAMIGTPSISTVTIDDDESEEHVLFVYNKGTYTHTFTMYVNRYDFCIEIII